jgi:hypothetical protein
LSERKRGWLDGREVPKGFPTPGACIPAVRCNLKSSICTLTWYFSHFIWLSRFRTEFPSWRSRVRSPPATYFSLTQFIFLLTQFIYLSTRGSCGRPLGLQLVYNSVPWCSERVAGVWGGCGRVCVDGWLGPVWWLSGVAVRCGRPQIHVGGLLGCGISEYTCVACV